MAGHNKGSTDAIRDAGGHFGEEGGVESSKVLHSNQ